MRIKLWMMYVEKECTRMFVVHIYVCHTYHRELIRASNMTNMVMEVELYIMMVTIVLAIATVANKTYLLSNWAILSCFFLSFFFFFFFFPVLRRLFVCCRLVLAVVEESPPAEEADLDLDLEGVIPRLLRVFMDGVRVPRELPRESALFEFLCSFWVASVSVGLVTWFSLILSIPNRGEVVK